MFYILWLTEYKMTAVGVVKIGSKVIDHILLEVSTQWCRNGGCL